MEVTVTRKKRHAVVTVFADRLAGEVVGLLKSELIEVAKGEQHLILDLGLCDGSDAAGMDVILVARRLCRNMRKRLILCRVRPEVARMMAVCQLDTLVQSCESLEDAEDQLA